MKFEDYNWPLKNPNHTAYQHQKDTTEFLLRNKRAFVLSDMGTGKTLSALWATDILFEMNAIKRVLIIAPLTTLQLVWGYELFTNFPNRYYAIAHGTRQDCQRAMNSEAHYIILNHDSVKFRFEELYNMQGDILIIDELTAFKNISADRHKAMKKIANRFKAVWGMTGAPTPNSPTEAYGQAKVVNPNNPDLPRYYGQYRDIVATQVALGIWIPTIHAEQMVHRVLQPAIRFTRDECLDIPPVTRQKYELEMTKEQKRLYDDMKTQMYASYDRGEITAVNAGVNLMKLLQISAGAVYDDERFVCYCDADSKLDLILEIFEELGRTKLIVVAAFVNVVLRLTEKLQSLGIRADCVYGEVKNRTQIIDRFQKRDLQILIVQPQAVSHGVTLTAANTIVWHSYIQSGETHLQMNDRINRIGQTRKQYVIYLTCSKAEEKTVQRLEGKKDRSDSVLEMFANHEF